MSELIHNQSLNAEITQAFIKVKQVRIGSYITAFNEEVPIIVTPKIIYDLFNGSTDYHPIIISDEILKRAGFTRFDSSSYVFDKDIFVVKSSISNEIDIYLYQSEQSDVFLKSVKYLHELQDLIFLIFGKELTLK